MECGDSSPLSQGVDKSTPCIRLALDPRCASLRKSGDKSHALHKPTHTVECARLVAAFTRSTCRPLASDSLWIRAVPHCEKAVTSHTHSINPHTLWSARDSSPLSRGVDLSTPRITLALHPRSASLRKSGDKSHALHKPTHTVECARLVAAFGRGRLVDLSHHTRFGSAQCPSLPLNRLFPTFDKSHALHKLTHTVECARLVAAFTRSTCRPLASDSLWIRAVPHCEKAVTSHTHSINPHTLWSARDSSPLSQGRLVDPSHQTRFGSALCLTAKKR